MPAAPATASVAVSDIEMADASQDASQDPEKTAVKKIQQQLQLIATAVAEVDLRQLSRLQLAAIKRTVTGPILKKCVELYLADADPLKDGMLLLLKGEKHVLRLDIGSIGKHVLVLDLAIGMGAVSLSPVEPASCRTSRVDFA